MRERKDLKEKVERKIQEEIIKYQDDVKDPHLDTDGSSIYQDFLKCGFIRISSPKEEMPMVRMIDVISLKNDIGGRSIKPGNIILNIRHLIHAIPGIIEMSVSIALDIPVLKICAALNLWKTLRNVITVPITRDQAFVIVALWKNCNQQHKIELNKGYDAVNALYSKYGEPQISEIKYNKIIDSLITLECIELDNEQIWLREWISKRYIDTI